MTNRRSFIRKASTLGAGLWAWPLIDTGFAKESASVLQNFGNVPPAELASDEDFWSWVRHNYTTSTNLINLNNGGVSPHPKVVQDAVQRFTELSNEAPSYYMWRVFEKGRESIREKLADLAGVSSEEIAINRNTTEALDTIIFGFDMQKGDEFVTSNFIYPNMNQAWMQREMREGVVRKVAKIPMPSTDVDAIVKAYTDQFTSKTKVVLIEHVINWTGQVLPVAAIAAERQKNEEYWSWLMEPIASPTSTLKYPILTVTISERAFTNGSVLHLGLECCGCEKNLLQSIGLYFLGQNHKVKTFESLKCKGREMCLPNLPLVKQSSFT